MRGNRRQSEAIKRQSDVIGDNQCQSESIRGNQRQSERGRRQSEAIRCNQMQSKAKAIRCNQMKSKAISSQAASWRGHSSEVFRGNHGQSEVINGRTAPWRCQPSKAIKGNQRQSVDGQRLGGVNHRRQSVAIKGCTIGGDQMQSVAIRWQSVDGQRLGGVYNQRRQLEAIGGNRRQSRGNQSQSEPI